MTTTILPLDRQNLPPSLDARRLREEGRERIEALAGDHWTDYNTHDPGITILEVLAYAITDLGLRTHLDMAELIGGEVDNIFLTAAETQPSAPYTTADYRRILIDHQDVRDAWLESNTGDIKGLHAFSVDLELADGENLEEEWIHGDPLIIADTAGPEETLRTYRFSGVFPAWETLPDVWNSNKELQNITIEQVEVEEDGNNPLFYRNFLVKYQAVFGTGNTAETLEDQALHIRLPVGIPVNAIDEDETPHADVFSELVQEQLNISFFNRYVNRFRARSDKIKNIRQYIWQKRNLGTDYDRVDAIRSQEIGLMITSLELRPEADVLEVLSQIYVSIEQFISPKHRPATLQQLLASGQSMSDILTGPLLENGFLDDDVLEKPRSDNLFTSDLIRIIMQQQDVIGLTGLTLDLYVNRFKIAAGVRNCLQLRNPKSYSPKLSFDDSKVVVFKGGVAYDVDRNALRERIEQRRTAYLDSFPVENQNNLPAASSSGDQLDLANFYSIQNEFPSIYGLREGEIVRTAPALRKGQARQLKAYLLFFEQLLVNYAAQLSNIQQLFSTDELVDRTYFFQPLYQVPAVRDLLTAFTEQTSQDWTGFRESCNDYIRALDRQTEDRQTFISRRNQFADHLLARFGEDFSPYDAWAYANNDSAFPFYLVLEKLKFLRDFSSLSSQRGQAFDYTQAERWDTDNVSGFEKRAAALLGMPDLRRRSLAQLFDIDEYLVLPGPGEEGPIRIKSSPEPDNFDILLATTEEFAYSDPGLEQAKQHLVREAQKGKSYTWISQEGSSDPNCIYQLGLLKKTLEEGESPFLARHDGNFTSRVELEKAVQKIVYLLQGRQGEGMHLVEHVLLRPISDENPGLSPVTFQESGGRPLIGDPYSYQVSIFLPGWAPRFTDPEFRVIVEQTLRRQLPAHLFAWIFWVEQDGDQVPPTFIAFEQAFRDWLEHYDTEEREAYRNAFVLVFNELIASDHLTLTNTYQAFEL